MKKDNKPYSEDSNKKPIDLCIGAYKHILDYDKKFANENAVVSKTNSRQIQSELHKMEQEMKCLDFSFLEIEKMNNQLENESLNLYINFLKGE